jgi:SET domain-containing protein
MNVEVRDVKNKGKGIFALKDFKKGEHILDITGEIIETENPSDYPEEIRGHWGPMGKEGNKYRFIKPEEPWMFMNHSCDSNGGVINDRKLIASRDILKGEEITVDYSTYDIESLTQGKKQLMMECKCGSKNCRKVISAFDRLNKKDQDRLKKFLNPYLRKKYLGSKKN